MEEITWEVLADVYSKETGGRARIQPMDAVFKWAVDRKDLFKLTPSGGLSLIKPSIKGE
jgi:hypothetical protein